MQARARIEAAADRLLSLAQVKTAPVPVFDLPSLAGATLRVGPLPDNLSGFLVRQSNSVIIGVNQAHATTRQRFTVSHELGHLLLHPQGSFIDHDFPIYFRDERSHTADLLPEIEANKFAANLLMPRRLIDPVIRKPIDIEDTEQLTRLALRFAVSLQAITYRLINLGIAK